MVLHRHILFSLATANIADAVLIRTSAEQVQSLLFASEHRKISHTERQPNK